MGSLSYSRDMDIQSIYLWFLVNGDNYFVCRMYGTDSQDSGYSVSCLGNDSADSGSCPVPDHELDADEGLGEIPERRNLYDPFCGEHGSRNDADNHCVPDGVAVDVQAEENVIQYRNSPFTNHRKCVTIFPYGKLMEEESTCVHRTTGKSPEDFLDAGCDAVDVIDLRQSEW